MAADSAPPAGAALTYAYIRPPGRVSMFTAELISAGESLIAMELTLDRDKPLVIAEQEVIGDAYRAIWFLVKGEGWDIAAIFRPDGTFSGYYVDVLNPVHWQDADSGSLLPIVDLFLDLWIWPDGSYEVLDEDEFAEAVKNGWVTDQQRDRALRVLAELQDGVLAGAFPPAEVREIAEK